MRLNTRFRGRTACNDRLLADASKPDSRAVTKVKLNNEDEKKKKKNKKKKDKNKNVSSIPYNVTVSSA
jgi:hypothetical protein